jgi:hypothetical protein
MRIHLRALGAAILTINVASTLSMAGTELGPGSLLADPESYQSQVVRVTGTVANHKIRRSHGNRCYQSFTIMDDTGAIRAVHGASCAGVKNPLRNRDIVTVDARFEWAPGESGLLNVHSVVARVAPSAQ